jgi:hypothetical protein
MDLMLDVIKYLESGGNEYNKGLNNKLLDLLAERAQELLKRAGEACLTQDAVMAQILAKQLRSPGGSVTYQEVANRLTQKFGDKALKDVEEIGKQCAYGLEMKSTLSFDAEGSTLFSSAEVERIPLHPSFGNGQVRLWGGYDMKLKHYVTGTCSYPIQQYDSLWLEVGMDLIYQNDKLIDIDLNQYKVHGWTAAAGASGSGKDCPTAVRLVGGGDYWTPLFIVSRQVNGGFSLRGWNIQADDPKYVKSLTATWESVVPSFPAPGGGKMSEDSKFKLVVKKNK